jgi:hypothetical protein
MGNPVPVGQVDSLQAGRPSREKAKADRHGGLSYVTVIG